jgi:hypothetical protein
MRMFTKDANNERRFYYCLCGKRVTFLIQISGMSED